MHRITSHPRRCDRCPTRSSVQARRCVARREPWTDRAPLRRASFVGLTVTEALAKLDCPGLREIRRQIADGTYLTEDKLNIAYERLVAILHRLRDESERVTA